MSDFSERRARRAPAIRRASIATIVATSLLASSLCAFANDPRADEFSLQTEQFARTSSSIRAALPLSGGMVDTTGIASLDSLAGAFVRLESALNFDLDGSKRLRVGDTVSNSGTLGSAVRFAGLQIGTPFAARSDLLMANRLALAGTAIIPTSLDAMLASQPRSKAEKSANRFTGRGLSLQNTPHFTQRGLSFTARDSLGQANTLTRTLLPTYSAPASGCDNYSIGLGRARVDYALTSNSYGQLFANGTVVCALDSKLTVEAHSEYLHGENGIAGLSLFKPIGAIGTASVSVATSENNNGAGWLVRVGLQHTTERLDVNVRAHVQSPEYREIGAIIVGDSVEQRFVASAGGRLTARNALSVAFINQTTYGLEQSNTLALSSKTDLGEKGAVAITAHRALDSKIGSGAAATAEAATVTMSYTKQVR